MAADTGRVDGPDGTSDDTGDDLPDAPTTVVFDIGEVLIDETRVWSIWAQLIGVSPLTFAAVLGAAVVQGEDHHAVFEHLAPNLDWAPMEPEHEARYGGFRDEDLYADVRPCLAELQAQGVRVVLAGNQPERRTEQLVALDLPVDRIVTSDELGAEKPTPEFFAAVLALLDGATADQVLYVGDRVDNDVLPAGAAGLRTCWLRRGPWGVLQDLPLDDDADLVLDGLGELPHLLATWRGDA
jgi:HAD superfamily hydrolase (TIGR01549 family)